MTKLNSYYLDLGRLIPLKACGLVFRSIACERANGWICLAKTMNILAIIPSLSPTEFVSDKMRTFEGLK